MIDNPEFRLPFTFTDDDAQLVPLDSDTAIQQSVYAILAYELGFRIDLPDFGVTDQSFKMNGVDPDQLEAIVTRWDPRAVELFESDPNWVRSLFQTITVRRSPNA